MHGQVARRIGLLVLVVAAIPAIPAAAADAPSFKVAVKRADDRVEVKVETEKTIVSIHSPFGISRAEIERTGEKWPAAIVLRLHLSGLERFAASNGKVQLEASVSSQDGRVRLWKDGKEDSPLDATSVYWMPIEKFGGNGPFELRLPRAMFESNPKSLTLHWIDFYRG